MDISFITICLCLIVCSIVGFILYFYFKDSITDAHHKAEIERIEANSARIEAEHLHIELDNAHRETEQTHREAEQARKEAEQARRGIEQARNEIEQARNEANQARHETEMARIGADHARMDAEMAHKKAQQIEEFYEGAMKDMKEQFAALSEQMLRRRQTELDKVGRVALTNIVAPLHQELTKMQQSMMDARTDTAARHAALDKAIEALSGVSHDMVRQTADLTRALQSGGKMQGDWGEQLLATILEGSGLRQGEEFTVQTNVKDKDGNNLRPDVIVNCPGGRRIIIDSKVSLTAYLNYNAAQTREQAEEARKENLRSVRAHIDELTRKQYDRLVPGALDQVLMFIPNEGSYILALQADPQIGQYAYRKNIILINPTNLMLALQMIYNLWQTERQNKNTEQVMRQAADLYDKFTVFCDKFSRIRRDVDDLKAHAEDAFGTLTTGRGNIVRRLEGLKELGVTPKKQIGEEYLGE